MALNGADFDVTQKKKLDHTGNNMDFSSFDLKEKGSVYHLP